MEVTGKYNRDEHWRISLDMGYPLSIESEMRIIPPHGLNKGFSSNFLVIEYNTLGKKRVETVRKGV